MNTSNNNHGKSAARRNDTAQRNGVRVMLATGATLATLIGAQSLAFIEQPSVNTQAAEATTEPQTSNGVVIVYKDNSTSNAILEVPAATTTVPTAVQPVTATPFVTPATRAANTTVTATPAATSTATSTSTATKTVTATATKASVATKAAVVVQPAPRTRSSR